MILILDSSNNIGCRQKEDVPPSSPPFRSLLTYDILIAESKADQPETVDDASSNKFKWTWKMNGTLAYGDAGAAASELVMALDMVTNTHVHPRYV